MPAFGMHLAGCAVQHAGCLRDGYSGNCSDLNPRLLCGCAGVGMRLLSSSLNFTIPPIDTTLQTLCAAVSGITVTLTGYRDCK